MTEYRVVCVHGDDGWPYHRRYTERADAEGVLQALNDPKSPSDRLVCQPFRIEVRDIGDWHAA